MSLDAVDPDWLAARRAIVGASEVGALVGLHPHMTALDLWAAKSGLSPPIEDTEAMERGRLVEGLAIKKLRQLRPDWTIIRNAQPSPLLFIDRPHRMGATPDAFAFDPARGWGTVQVKSVHPLAFRRSWEDDDGDVILPVWIALQATVEAHLTGVAWATVAALVIDQGVRLELIEVPHVAGVVERLRLAVAEFWNRVELEAAPDADFGRDLELIKRLAPPLREGVEIDLSGDNELIDAIARHAELAADIAALKKQLEPKEALIRQRVGGAERAIAGAWRVTLKQTKRKGYTVPETTYRALKISQPSGE